MKIKVVDSIMGSGKTSAAINMINSSDEDTKFIYITPYLTEIERIKKQCSEKNFHEPTFKSVKGELVTKFDSFHDLLMKQKNIVSTHALFSRANEITRDLIEAGGYTLILDEVMDVVEQVNVKASDIKAMFQCKMIYEKDGLILWNDVDHKDYDGLFNEVRDMARNQNLVKYKDNVLMWAFPANIFESFKDVYVITYMFDAQVQKYYYDLHDINYEYYYATKINGEYAIKQGSNKAEDKLKRLEIIKLIDIIDGNLNDIGKHRTALSKSWYTNKKPLIDILKKNTINFFINKAKSKSSDNMWTTFKSTQSKLKGKGYTSGFVPCNARATNDYKHKTALAYLMNRFSNPIVKGYFDSKGITIDEDKYATSELIQWVWRSAIRDGVPIMLYIPSKRMRDLLKQWMNE